MDVDFVRMLTVLGRVDPAIWDWIIPHGPRVATSIERLSPGSLVELNPQPIPPGRQVDVASAVVAHTIATATIAAVAQGSEGASRIIYGAVDDWCGTKPPHLPFPWPGPWPFPWAIDDLGSEDADRVASASRLIGGLTLASIASRMADGEARQALSDGADKLIETALAT